MSSVLKKADKLNLSLSSIDYKTHINGSDHGLEGGENKMLMIN